MITAAAILREGKAYTGRRHANVFQDGTPVHGLPFGAFKNCEQGFVDEDGKFYSRDEAAVEALKCHQIDSIPRGVFLSEDLW
jgi:hypothetical protein